MTKAEDGAVVLAHDVAGDGPTLVLLHAAIGDRQLWNYQWPWLTSSHRTLRCDLRGYGQTPLPAEPYRSASDVLDLLALVGITRAVLIGGSLGGRVALEVAVARPDVVAALVVVSPSLPAYDWSDEVRAFGDAEDDALDIGDIETAVELNMKMWFDGHGRTSTSVDAGRRFSVAAMQRRAFELQRTVGGGAVEELLVPDLADRISEIPAPTLVMVGEHDASDFHAIGARLTARLGNAHLKVLPDTAHVPYYERPEVFDPFLVDALADLG